MNSDQSDREHYCMTHRYAWSPRGYGDWRGFHRKSQPCRILTRGAMNSALIEFADGFQAVVSRNALRRLALPCPPACTPPRRMR